MRGNVAKLSVCLFALVMALTVSPRRTEAASWSLGSVPSVLSRAWTSVIEGKGGGGFYWRFHYTHFYPYPRTPWDR